MSHRKSGRARPAVHVGERYVIDVAPRHPITSPKLCTVTAVEGRRVSATYATSRGDVAVTVDVGLVLYDEAERERRIAAEAEKARWWREERPRHATQAAAAQRHHDREHANGERGLPPFPVRGELAVA